jgi:hypothetical protein
MPKRVTTSSRASETVTIRLTKQQKTLLDRIVSETGVTATDLFRTHICQRAQQLGVDETGGSEAAVPFAPPPSADEGLSASRAPAAPPPPAENEPFPREIAAAPGSFGALTARYRLAFADRGEGTQRELDEALRFFSTPHGDGLRAPLPAELSLAALTSDALAEVRERTRCAPLRLSRKNLFLTYLRMMLHFAFKRGAIAFDVAPGAELRAITAAEVDEPWGMVSEAPPAP